MDKIQNVQNVLMVDLKTCTIHFHELPQNVFDSLVDVSTTRVFWEILFQWDLMGYKETEDENNEIHTLDS